MGRGLVTVCVCGGRGGGKEKGEATRQIKGEDKAQENGTQCRTQKTKTYGHRTQILSSVETYRTLYKLFPFPSLLTAHKSHCSSYGDQKHLNDPTPRITAGRKLTSSSTRPKTPTNPTISHLGRDGQVVQVSSSISLLITAPECLDRLHRANIHLNGLVVPRRAGLLGHGPVFVTEIELGLTLLVFDVLVQFLEVGRECRPVLNLMSGGREGLGDKLWARALVLVLRVVRGGGGRSGQCIQKHPYQHKIDTLTYVKEVDST